MSTNSTSDYNDIIRGSLPGDITYSGNRYRFNNDSYFTYKQAYWQWRYLKSLETYKANDIQPDFVADFANHYYKVSE